jgi:Flp pilus assembly protein TadG
MASFLLQRMTMKRTWPTRRRGATLVEFALVVPALLLILLGILEFGWYGRNQLAVANAAREGARVASIGKTTADIRTRIINTAIPVTVSTSHITLQQSTNNGVSWQTFPNDDNGRTPAQNGVASGDMVKVILLVPHRRLINMPLTPANYRVSVVMVRERA